MGEEQKGRTAPVAAPERSSPLDRVKQVQEMQRQAESAAVTPGRPAAAPAKAAMDKAVRGPRDGFKAEEIAKPSVSIAAQLPAAPQAVYAKAQVDPSSLFGGPPVEINIVGNPWKVIDFGGQLPAVFDKVTKLSDYEAKVPKDAVAIEGGGFLFPVQLQPKKGGGEPITRAVITDSRGTLRGAECKDQAALTRLITMAPHVAQGIRDAAFERGSHGTIANIAKRGDSFLITVDRGSESQKVKVNNFGLPNMKPIDISAYHLDRFEF